MMDRLVFAAVADDDTGASDLAGMLAEQGLRTLLVIDLPSSDQLLNWSRGYHAVLMAVGTRNLTPELARERTREAIRLLETRRPRVFQIKYCSTFDSTPEGNIGPTIDVALDELDEDFTIALPALPVNGRTTYLGYHFVHQQLLSDSPMRNHPLTPMTDPNLVALLSRQTKHQVGLVPYVEVEAGGERLKQYLHHLRESGVVIALVDCLNDQHLEDICRAVADLRLITGSSAFGMKLPAIWRERGWLAEAQEEISVGPPLTTNGYGCLIVAGSCSVATRGQNEWLAAQGTHVIQINPLDLLTVNSDQANVIAQARGQLNEGRHCLLTTSSAPDKVRQVQGWGGQRGFSVRALGEGIASALADLVSEILRDQAAGGLIMAGGETSGAVCRRLELGALRVGRNIEPGVPLCFSLGRLRLPVALKSGNFGSPDFYGKALEALAQPARYLT
ncbi:MAG TPA: 3-oxo-tetronate kinase [Pyrinomonadaceae bacterium]|nr:3-oxo-tetronate kinase [Pyrinomonadaceae bacterium]